VSDEVFHYLAYGSNLHPLRLSERVGPVECLGKVHLPGWRLCFDKRGSDGSAKANLRAAPDSSHQAWGAVFRLQRRQYVALDRFEGCGRGYETFWLDLMIDGSETPVLTYLTPSHWQSSQSRPYDWYLAFVMAGARFHQFPTAAIEDLGKVESIADPDEARAHQQRLLIERMKQGS
jgi:gamma-glutamylcyclotransferase